MSLRVGPQSGGLPSGLLVARQTEFVSVGSPVVDVGVAVQSGVAFASLDVSQVKETNGVMRFDAQLASVSVLATRVQPEGNYTFIPGFANALIGVVKVDADPGFVFAPQAATAFIGVLKVPSTPETIFVGGGGGGSRYSDGRENRDLKKEEQKLGIFAALAFIDLQSSKFN